MRRRVPRRSCAKYLRLSTSRRSSPPSAVSKTSKATPALSALGNRPRVNDFISTSAATWTTRRRRTARRARHLWAACLFRSADHARSAIHSLQPSRAFTARSSEVNRFQTPLPDFSANLPDRPHPTAVETTQACKSASPLSGQLASVDGTLAPPRDFRNAVTLMCAR